ncbi:MAG: paraslipin [Smithellaceae bacterium]|jgi:regulator of protease activity HflC (stomatin/prohibitin superfamily)|nr:paraslipin [Smithellaceae bacterium]MDD5415058.1 paraslipin [Smithellaceae bacterium]HCS76578.1 paraslipin [Syntrophaceae bacterium]
MEIVLIVVALLAVIIIAKGVCIVPQQSAYVVERLGKFDRVLNAGISYIIPFIDRKAYVHTLKEQAMDIPEQICITRDNVQVGVDGVIFIQVFDPQMASYGISNYMFSIIQLAQTTMRSEVGKIDLDKTFEERTTINSAIVSAINDASRTWGVKILRYEIKNIRPPENVLNAMEKQMQAEREKRAVILQSEGEKQSAVNVAEGQKQKVVLESEAVRQKQINEATGQAEAIRAIASATADGLKAVAGAVQTEGGMEAVQLRVAEKLVEQFGHLAKQGNTLILPANFGDISSLIATAMSVVKQTK